MMTLFTEIDKRATLITVLGTLLCLWFVFESIQFIYSGKLWELGKMLPQFFQNSFLLGSYVLFHLIIASVGAFFAIPLVYRGRTSGLVLGIAYRLSGNTIDPFSFLFPDALLIAPSNEPTFLFKFIDVLWLIISLAVLLLYFFLRRHKSSQ